MIGRGRAVLVVAAVLAACASASLSSQTSRSTLGGLLLLQKLQDALGGATRLASVGDYQEVIRAQAWDSAGNALGEVRKRTRWIKTPNVIRLDQRGPRGTYVLFFDRESSAGWEIPPQLSGPDPYQTTGKVIALADGELRFAKAYLAGFELNQWLADRRPGYAVTSPNSGVLRIEHDGTATDFTLDPATNLPVKSAGISLADPARPVPSEMRYTAWKVVAAIRFPTRRANYLSGLRRGEVTTEDIRINVGLKVRDLAAKPTNFAPDLP
jgi:hypothetical protein